MDFTKTSSLRALIELNFQRNWKGIIWMSRKGVIAKRVKTVQTALSRISAQTAQSGWPRNACSALGQSCVRPTEVSAKSKTTRPITHHDPGNSSPRSATPQLAAPQPRTTKARDPGNYASRPAEDFHRPIPIRPTTPAIVITSGPDRSDSAKDPTVRPTVPHDRPNAAVDPKPFLKPNPHNSSPKPAPT
ncbi:unnamed protein product [Microthlaspi erraticum]|uniref:Uncharacterized protein n=1 Tax=Microthlaspi erraticum TaxID=1685480 RepID=A0A6D2J3J2_9BRAS|nr:unnamed protein product [Microthlaspi erraticum]